ncbi:vWA domain-containing protein [Dactylosporangium darangshiense]|uniref:vWA domain-containing protein n=1 Tax=Dactylosporangium darangshiense TaxID=579108 RepID=UPI003635C2EF
MSEADTELAFAGTDAALAASGPDAALAGLAGSTTPFLIGVRHHSPALSAVVEELLDGFRPEVLLLELPAEFASWLPWLADPATKAPVALAGVVGGDGAPAFYPFADFSPELVAVRWAARNGVEVVPCDLPLSARAWRTPAATPTPAGDNDGAPVSFLGDALKRSATGRPDEDMWDRVVETRAPGATAEAVRRAALLVGWAMRRDTAQATGVPALDLAREAWMRRCLAEAGPRRAAAVVGSFHAAALLAPPLDPAATSSSPTPAVSSPSSTEPARDEAGGVVTSLVPYSFGLLDARSGYPAGIRDPRWQQAVVAAGGRPEAVEAAALASVVEVCARVRAGGHPAGPAEAREVFRLATDLARLRGLPAPGRGELIESLQSVLAHGEVLGRGRVVAAAMETVLVGDVRGALAPGAPRSGLRPAAEAELARLRLPGPGEATKDLRLDPLRSDLDRRRDVALRRLAACRIPYAEHTAVEGTAGVDALTTRWSIEWTPGTEAMLDVAGVRGVTLAQAAEGALRERRRADEGAEGPTAAQIIAGLAAAAECGLPGLAAERLAELAAEVPASATLEELMRALALLDRLGNGHVPGLPAPEAAALADLPVLAEALEAAAVRQVDGLAGSEDVADVHALVALGRRADAAGVGLRLADALDRLTATGTPTMAAAAGAVQVLLGLSTPAVLGTRVASWIDAAGSDESRRRLLGHLRGLLAAAEPLLQSGPDALDGLLDRVASMSDAAFLSRLPALRGGFQAVSPAGRDRLLAVVEDRLGDGVSRDLNDTDPAALLHHLLADRAGRAAAEALGLLPAAAADPPAATADPDVSLSGPDTTDTELDPATTDPSAATADESDMSDPSPRALAVLDRWRLLLGRQDRQLGGAARRFATALDELYGAGSGEGSAADAGGRAGREAPFPGVREWAEELTALFGTGIREEVLARAAEAGRRDAVMLLDPDRVNPSVELLQTVLSLAGGMPESTVARLRPLVARIVDELTRRLATRLRPALAGITTPRPTYRPGGPLDLPRTLRANLASTRRDADGRVQVIPERPVFRTRARRGVDWRLVLVVDVSGSMEASVIWSALTGAILAGVPALTTHFVAFSTEVVDLTDRVSDPLTLLLEVQVGGGTHIAKGLRHARSLVTVPSRTLVVLVSDFEEGYPLGGLLAETRALVESGVTVLGCASLDDAGRPRYSVSIASQLVAAGMPVAALSPLELARWVAEKVRS